MADNYVYALTNVGSLQLYRVNTAPFSLTLLDEYPSIFCGYTDMWGNGGVIAVAEYNSLLMLFKVVSDSLSLRPDTDSSGSFFIQLNGDYDSGTGLGKVVLTDDDGYTWTVDFNDSTGFIPGTSADRRYYRSQPSGRFGIDTVNKIIHNGVNGSGEVFTGPGVGAYDYSTPGPGYLAGLGYDGTNNTDWWLQYESGFIYSMQSELGGAPFELFKRSFSAPNYTIIARLPGFPSNKLWTSPDGIIFTLTIPSSTQLGAYEESSGSISLIDSETVPVITSPYDVSDIHGSVIGGITYIHVGTSAGFGTNSGIETFSFDGSTLTHIDSHPIIPSGFFSSPGVLKVQADSILPPTPPPVADFTSDVTSGPADLSVQFTDLSTESPTSWNWDFGDGGTSTEQNPQHTYDTGGIYPVKLTVVNAGGSDEEEKFNYIEVEIDAEFAATPIVGPIPLVVQFTDLSTGNPDDWLWNFGDGQTSTEQSPQHTYSSPGEYSVSLRARRNSAL